MNDRGPDNSRDAAGESARDGATPRELRGVARLLDQRGARERARLGPDSVERIFAASNLQRPLDFGAVSPVAGRIGPARTQVRVVARIAAAIAAAAGIGAIVMLALSTQRNPAREGAELARDTAEPPIPVVSPDVVAPRLMPALAAEHLDSALEGSIAAPTVSRGAGAVIVALADRNGAALAHFEGAERSISDELEPLLSSGSLFGDGDLTFDGLSEEIAMVASAGRAPG